VDRPSSEVIVKFCRSWRPSSVLGPPVSLEVDNTGNATTTFEFEMRRLKSSFLRLLVFHLEDFRLTTASSPAYSEPTQDSGYSLVSSFHYPCRMVPVITVLLAIIEDTPPATRYETRNCSSWKSSQREGLQWWAFLLRYQSHYRLIYLNV
jgi:hypothetical protein